MLKGLAKAALVKSRTTKYKKAVNAKSSAYDKWQHAQEKEPVIIMLGDIYEKMGEYPYAISEYKKYLSENPESAVIYNQLGMCQIRQGDYDGAISSFEMGLALDDKNLNQAIEFNEITTYEYMGNFDTAKSLMDTYRQKYPDDEEAEREYVFLSTR